MNKHLSLALNIFIGITALIIFFGLFELGLRVYRSQQEASKIIPLYITTDKPYLYRMNPEHDKVNSFGLRDDEISLEKPAGVYRILVLGDSIAYGRAVGLHDTFPNQLERYFTDQGNRVEVINAGVSGYTPYNELYYYLEEGRKFDPDLVILAFCMNDIANPRLHWGYTQEKITHIPDEAIPNKTYDQEVIQPLLKERQESLARKLEGAQSMASAIIKSTGAYQFVASRLAVIFPDKPEQKLQARLPETTSTIPTHITAEDNLGIELLTRTDTEEWLWLSGMYTKIHQAVGTDQIPLVVAIFPLAYQLDENYPHYPQTLFADYCQKEKLPCVDLLESFRKEGKEKIFMLDKERGYDIWHLTEDGHASTARVLYHHIITAGYIH